MPLVTVIVTSDSILDRYIKSLPIFDSKISYENLYVLQAVEDAAPQIVPNQGLFPVTFEETLTVSCHGVYWFEDDPATKLPIVGLIAESDLRHMDTTW